MSLFYPAGYSVLRDATLHVGLPEAPLPSGYFESLTKICGETVQVFPLFTDFSRTPLQTLKEKFYSKCCVEEGQAYFKLTSSATQQIPSMQSQVYLTIHRLFELLSSLSLAVPAPPSCRKGEIQFPEQQPEIQALEQEPETQKQSFPPVLPPEVWIEIFKGAITSSKDIQNISQVSKLFYSLVNPALIKKLADNPSLVQSPQTDPVLIDECIKRGVFTKELKQQQVKLTDEHLRAISVSKEGDPSRLKALTLTGNEYTLEGFASALRGCNSLKEIEFKSHHGENFDDYILLLSEFAPQIEKITIVDCPSMTDRSLLALMRCKNLKSFEYRDQQGDGQLTDYGLLPFLMAVKPETLQLAGCPRITQVPLIAYIQKNPRLLTSLDFSYCGLIDDRLLRKISSCSRLSRLGLGMSENQRGDLDGKKAEALGNILISCPLEDVKIHDCEYLPLLLVQQLIRMRGPYLRRLDLQRFTGPSSSFEPDIFAKLLSCTNLESLSFLPKGSQRAATGEAILHLLSACAHLQTLEIAHHGSSTSKSIPGSSSGQFFSGVHPLKNLTLHVTGEELEPGLISALGDVNLNHLAILLGPSLTQDMGQLAMDILPKWKELTQFHLRSMTEESGISKIDPSMLQVNPNLSELTVEGLAIQPDQKLSFPIITPMTHLGLPRSKITEADFTILLEKTGRSLRSLDLEGCDWVDAKVLSAIANSCPHLEYLNIQETSVSEEEINRFEQAAQSLVYLGATQ